MSFPVFKLIDNIMHLGLYAIILAGMFFSFGMTYYNLFLGLLFIAISEARTFTALIEQKEERALIKEEIIIKNIKKKK